MLSEAFVSKLIEALTTRTTLTGMRWSLGASCRVDGQPRAGNGDPLQ